jgi:hypothetical protein
MIKVGGLLDGEARYLWEPNLNDDEPFIIASFDNHPTRIPCPMDINKKMSKQ